MLSSTYLTRPTIDIDLFQNPYVVLYSDLYNQEEGLKSGSTKLELKYTLLSGTPNAEYNMFALILHEEEISVDVMSVKFVLRA